MDKSKILKIISLVIFVLLMVYLTMKFIPLFKSISTAEGRIAFKEDIEGLGVKGIFAIVGLMITQIFLPILPRRTSRSISWNVVWTNRRTICNIFRCIYK